MKKCHFDNETSNVVMCLTDTEGKTDSNNLPCSDIKETFKQPFISIMLSEL